MSFTTAQKNHLNKMNKAAKDVSLGTLLDGLEGLSDVGTIASGSWLVTSSEANGSRIVLTTGLSAIKGFMSSYLRSGSPTAVTIVSGSVAGTLVAKANSSASPLAADVVSYIAF